MRGLPVRTPGRTVRESDRVYTGIEIAPPLFEVGPKAYAYGRDVLDLAKSADTLSSRFAVQVIFTPQYVDIPLVAAQTQQVLVFAQHMDSLRPGRGTGSVLPEALKSAGAVGVLLNHAERRLSRSELTRTMRRANETGLATMVCADDPADAVSIARLGPDIIIVEAPDLIASGVGAPSPAASVAPINAAIWSINPRIRVLHAAGISSAPDVYNVVAAGAEGTGSSSAIFQARDRQAMLEAMIRAVREAWDATHSTVSSESK